MFDEVGQFVIRGLQTRLLFPFFYGAASEPAKLEMSQWGSTVDAALNNATFADLPPDRARWRAPNSHSDASGGEPDERSSFRIPGLYCKGVLPPVHDYLFQRNSPPDCRYYQFPSHESSSWFYGTSCKLPHPVSGEQCELDVRLANKCGVELFLSPYGCGVLSIGLAVAGSALDDHLAVRLHYRLAGLFLNNPLYLTTAVRDPKQNRPTSDGRDKASLARRLHAEGASFSLGELVTALLSPLESSLGIQQQQDRFSVYSVVRFERRADGDTQRAGEAEDGNDEELPETFEAEDEEQSTWQHSGTREDEQFRDRATQLATLLAEVVPESHPGFTDRQRTQRRLDLTRNHFAVVGSMGCAHIVVDQPGRGDQNQQRVSRARDGYFVPFLLAMLQRLSCQRFVAEANEIESREAEQEMASELRERQMNRQPLWRRLKRECIGWCKSFFRPHRERVSAFQRLRQRMLRFALNGEFSQISTRGTLQQFYRAAQEALEVPYALRLVRRAIADKTADRQAAHMQTNIERLTEIQTKVEWIEVFILAVYTVEVAHIFHLGFEHHVGGWFVTLAVLGFVLAFLIIWPPSRRSVLERKPVKLGAAAILLALMTFFVLSIGGRPEANSKTDDAKKHDDKTHLESEPEPADQQDLLDIRTQTDNDDGAPRAQPVSTVNAKPPADNNTPDNAKNHDRRETSVNSPSPPGN